MSAQAFVLLASALVPPLLAIGVYWFGFRLARRHDDEHGP